MSKRCSKCREPKPLTAFHRNASSSDGLQKNCKECQLAYIRQHYWRNRHYYLDKAKKRNRAVTEEARALVRAIKDVPCADCGRRYPYWVMHLDHVSGEKLFTIGRRYNSSRQRILSETAKCQVVCANCHAERTYQRFIARP